MKRILLFILTNLAVVLLLSFVVKVFGFDKLFYRGGGINFGALLGFSFVFGMGGAFISLAMSKWMAKFSTGAQVITSPSNQDERWLVETVNRQARDAGIGMPEVAVYDSPDMNAFATGMSRNSSLVAVSTGLLQQMSRDEVEAVLAHEVSHIANGDMVTMTLLQGILNTFVIFISKIVGYMVDRALSSNNDEENQNGNVGFAYYITSFIAEILFGILASIIVMWFSRKREYRADAGSARLVGANKMIRALQRLQMSQAGELPAQMTALGIAGAKKGGIMELFMSHPHLEDRTAALQQSGI